MSDDIDRIDSQRTARTGDLFDPADNPLAEALETDAHDGPGRSARSMSR